MTGMETAWTWQHAWPYSSVSRSSKLIQVEIQVTHDSGDEMNVYLRRIIAKNLNKEDNCFQELQ